MPVVVGVRFKPAGKIYYFNGEDVELKVGDKVIVETARGIEFGEVVIGRREVDEGRLVLPLKNVIRKATEQDMRQAEENRKREVEAYAICEAKIKEHGLPMNLIDVEYTFDRGK